MPDVRFCPAYETEPIGGWSRSPFGYTFAVFCRSPTVPRYETSQIAECLQLAYSVNFSMSYVGNFVLNTGTLSSRRWVEVTPTGPATSARNSPMMRTMHPLRYALLSAEPAPSARPTSGTRELATPTHGLSNFQRVALDREIRPPLTSGELAVSGGVITVALFVGGLLPAGTPYGALSGRIHIASRVEKPSGAATTDRRPVIDFWRSRRPVSESIYRGSPGLSVICRSPPEAPADSVFRIHRPLSMNSPPSHLRIWCDSPEPRRRSAYRLAESPALHPTVGGPFRGRASLSDESHRSNRPMQPKISAVVA